MVHTRQMYSEKSRAAVWAQESVSGGSEAQESRRPSASCMFGTGSHFHLQALAALQEWHCCRRRSKHPMSWRELGLFWAQSIHDDLQTMMRNMKMILRRCRMWHLRFASRPRSLYLDVTSQILDCPIKQQVWLIDDCCSHERHEKGENDVQIRYIQWAGAAALSRCVRI